ncbi:hypothetical protein E2C01_041958 [Portunus trituberculatus]|uniref:Reverse transcriptase zinc-binding domain-containing protein n=1 Tax=Portunus trituberculatus TaxID=210409 RepID=A0A5B7FL86_PORTR|nr:hypothetical protein [Portunus trituberculatus]
MSAVTRFKVSQSRKGTQARAAIAHLRLGHTRLRAHLHLLRLSPDLFCPWCRTTPKTIEHFLLRCLRFHFHTALHSQLSALAITTLDLPILLAASGVPASCCPKPYL